MSGDKVGKRWSHALFGNVSTHSREAALFRESVPFYFISSLTWGYANDGKQTEVNSECTLTGACAELEVEVSCNSEDNDFESHELA
jgi:hypothetical protein